MSVESSVPPQSGGLPSEEGCKDVEFVIVPRTRDLGGFTVGRILPYARRRMVGPFIFFDHIGPAEFAPNTGLDVRPHPHIGLATVTYLFEGEIRHRDNLGFDQMIRPGDVNWMTAGRGIVHSERTAAETRKGAHRLHGIQSWVALPHTDEETDPAFHHYPRTSLPELRLSGVSLRLIAGRAFGAESPAKVFSEMFYASAEAPPGSRLPLPDDYEERAIYIVSGTLSVNGRPMPAGRMLVFVPGSSPLIEAVDAARVMLLGGAPVGERTIWWNLVSSSQARIDAARAAWREAARSGFPPGLFALPPGEREYIPAPEE
jgi:redox-sensitive bicupin YhaK (pirin superfamily)